MSLGTAIHEASMAAVFQLSELPSYVAAVKRRRRRRGRTLRLVALAKSLLAVSEINHAHRVARDCARGAQRCSECPVLTCSDNMLKHELAALVE